MVGRKGLEPLCIMPLILSQSCLPVPASAHINNKRGLQLIRICLLPPTPQFIGGHLTGSVARRSTFFIFRIPLMVGMEGLEPSRAKAQQIFLLLHVTMAACALQSGLCLLHILRLRRLVYSLYTFINNRLFLKLHLTTALLRDYHDNSNHGIASHNTKVKRY